MSDEDVKMQLAEVKTKVDTLKEDITEIKNNSDKSDKKIDDVTISLGKQDIALDELKSDIKEMKQRQANFEDQYIDLIKKPTLLSGIGEKLITMAIMGGMIAAMYILIKYHVFV